MTIHLAGQGLDWALQHVPAAATYRDDGRICGALVILDEALPPRSGYWLAEDGRRLEFALDVSGIHPVREAVRFG